MTKEAKIYSGAKTVSSTSGARKTGQLHHPKCLLWWDKNRGAYTHLTVTSKTVRLEHYLKPYTVQK